MLTQIVVRAVKEFHISMDEVHNDSTTITLTGDYGDADGSMKRGKQSLKITYGHNKGSCRMDSLRIQGCQEEEKIDRKQGWNRILN